MKRIFSVNSLILIMTNHDYNQSLYKKVCYFFEFVFEYEFLSRISRTISSILAMSCESGVVVVHQFFKFFLSTKSGGAPWALSNDIKSVRPSKLYQLVRKAIKSEKYDLKLSKF